MVSDLGYEQKSHKKPRGLRTVGPLPTTVPTHESPRGSDYRMLEKHYT